MADLEWWAGEIPRRAGTDVVPLSFAQQRLWFLHQLEPDTPLYSVPFVLHLTGPLDLESLQRSLDTIVARHEALRTTFPADGGKPRQLVSPAAAFPLAIVDLPALPPSERERAVMQHVSQVAAQPFDLAAGPLFRAFLMRAAPEEHSLLILMHHIVTDRWSMGVIFRELSECYRAFRLGDAPRLPDLPIQYPDYALWQRAGLDDRRSEGLLEYWRRQLAGVPPTLELPTDRPRPAVESRHGARYRKLLPLRLARALRTLGRQEKATLYMVMLGAFQLLLARYTGRHDIVVGSPITGRLHSSLLPLIGFFVNTLVMRTDLSGDPTFRQLLNRVREVALGAFAHQDLPFERLVEAVQPERSMHHAPLVQVMLAFQNTPPLEIELPGLTVRGPVMPDQAAKFDLVLYLIEEEAGIRAEVEYGTEVLDPDTVDRFVGHYQTLLEAIVQDPDRPISTLSIMAADESRRILEEWNATDTEYPATATVHRLFEDQARRMPEAIAVVAGGIELTYAELNRRANRLANHLRSLGVAPDVPVAVLLDRSANLIVSLLAILKAGGAYLALEPGSPRDRLAWLLEDAGAPVLVTEPGLRSRLPEPPAGIAVVCLESDRALLERNPEEDPADWAEPGHLAYVCYTSGSTGRPKGVGVTHRGVVRLVRAGTHTSFAADEVFLQLAPVAFDASTLEIWGPLLNGARLVVAPPGRLTLEEIGRVIQRHGVTTLWLTAGLFHLMVDERLDDLRGLRHLMSGGDVLSPRHVRRFLAELPDCRLTNAYGPTECTTFTTCHQVARDDDLSASVPIGRPIAETRVYVLDGVGRTVPVGIPGELYVGGDGLARGYLDRPSLTAERFVPDPFGTRPGGRLYRTGDRVRWRPDGTLEYLGRLDRQVKLRGFRVEPGEIEAELARHPAIREAAVVVREDGIGDRRLLAYLVQDGADSLAPPPSSHALREHLGLRLPEYMIPTAFTWLQALPLTPQGKVDRAALPEPPADATGWDSVPVGTVGPRTPAEAALAGIWAEVLGLERVGVHDNFFDLGGDSILSLQIIARASQAGLRLTPRQLFEHQTIAELAAVAGVASAQRSEQPVMPGPVPLTPIQHWFFELELASPSNWSQAVLLETRELLDPLKLERTLRALLDHHDALRMRYHRSQEGWSQVNVAEEDSAVLSSMDLAGMSEAEQEATIAAATARAQGDLDLSDGPLMRAVWFDLGSERRGRLMWVIHHLVVDGVSWRILIEDLQLAYDQLARGEAVRLPPATTSFGQWAMRLESHARSSELRRELDYWLEQAGAEAPRLPVDSPGGRNTAGSARTVWTALDAEETGVLLHQVPAAYGTQINDCLLTALSESFARWTGARVLLMDLEGHGREEIVDGVDLTRSVGWFTTIYPVVLDLRQSLAPGEALKSVKEQLRAIPARGIGYGLLRYLGDDPAIAARLRALPQAEVSFNYLGQFDQALQSSPFEWIAEPIRMGHDPKGLRRHLISVTAYVRGDRLRVGWTYSAAVHRCETMEALAQGYLSGLRELIRHCQAPGAGGYTPSDFPDAGLDQRELDALIAGLDETVSGS